MQPCNNYLVVEPLKEGLMGADGNEYKVLAVSNPSPEEELVDSLPEYRVGKTVIVEHQFVINLTIKGKQCFFVRKENVLAVSDECTQNCDCRAKV